MGGGWITSVRGWLGGSPAMLCAFLAGASGFILYELDLRKHDYQILNLAGQMRVEFIGTAFRRFVSVDGLVLLVAAPEGGRFRVESRHGESVAAWPDLAESRDPETGDHLVRMSLYSSFIAEELGRRPEYRGLIDPGYVRSLHRFAPMHDIGKVGIADRVLLKPGRLDDEERLEMNKHPLIGAEVLRLCEQRMNELGRSVFRVGIEIAESHHEKWDGTGYPHGLKGAAIPMSARIVAVADVFDALTSKRPYKDAFSVEKALDIIHKDAGSHFDPEVVEALDRGMPRVLEIYDRLKHV